MKLLVLMCFMFSRESLITLLVACLWRFSMEGLWRSRALIFPLHFAIITFKAGNPGISGRRFLYALRVLSDKEFEMMNRREWIADNIGISLSAAINIFLKRFVAEEGFPFALKMQKETPGSLVGMTSVGFHGDGAGSAILGIHTPNTIEKPSVVEVRDDYGFHKPEASNLSSVAAGTTYLDRLVAEGDRRFLRVCQVR